MEPNAPFSCKYRKVNFLERELCPSSDFFPDGEGTPLPTPYLLSAFLPVDFGYAKCFSHIIKLMNIFKYMERMSCTAHTLLVAG